MAKKIEAILWDFDGALVDSLPIMEKCWQEVRDNLEFAKDIPFVRYKDHIGRPFPEMMSRLGITQKDAEDAEKIYFGSKHRDKLPLIYNGITDSLSRLKTDYKLGLVTSKDKETTDNWLSRLDLLKYFDDVQTPDGKKGLGKPNPYFILKSLDNLGIAPSNALYLGDMEVDYEAANRAGTAFAHTSWGYGDIEDLNPALELKTPKDLFKYLDFFK